MLATATAGSLKTMLVTVNAVVATELNVSYMSATALTGIPLIIGALFGIKSQILAQCIGKRTIYLASTIMMLLAAVGNMHVESSYAEFLITRIFQGMGWGAFEALVPGSISDMFHVCPPSLSLSVMYLANKHSPRTSEVEPTSTTQSPCWPPGAPLFWAASSPKMLPVSGTM